LGARATGDAARPNNRTRSSPTGHTDLNHAFLARPEHWQKRKIAALAALTLIVFGVGGLALAQMAEINARAANVRDNWLPSVSKIGQLNLTVTRVGRNENSLLLTVSAQHETAQALADYRASLEAVDKAYAEYKPMITPNAEDAVLMGRFAEAWPRYRKLTEDIIDRALKGNIDQAIDDSATLSAPQRLAIQDILAKDVAFNEAEGAKAAAAGESIYASARVVMLGALALAALVSIIASLSILASVVRPLGRAAAAVEQLAKGALDLDSPMMGEKTKSAPS